MAKEQATTVEAQAADLAAYMGEETVKIKALGAGLLANGINVDERTADFLLSAYTVDRDGEVLVPEGCKSDGYQVNPIVLLNHDRNKPIGHVVPWAATKFLDVRPADGVYGRVRFDETADGEDAWKMVQSGTLRASSPGFKPLTITREKSLPGQTGVTVTAWDLIEWSIVTVPCNPEAVRKSESNGVRSKTLRELFPDAYAALDQADHDRARFESDCARMRDAAKALRCSWQSVNSYLRHQTKCCVTRTEKAYTIEVAVRDSALPDALAELQQLGRVTSINFVPDEWLEQRLQEDVDGDGSEFANEDGTPRMMPGLGSGGLAEQPEDDEDDAVPYNGIIARSHQVEARPRGPQTEEKAKPVSGGSLTDEALGVVLGVAQEVKAAIQSLSTARDIAINERLTHRRRAWIGN